MKEIYIDIMERAFLAYDKERISAYIDDVKKNGLKEHGFPRLAADLAILNAFDRCTEYRELMLEMMDMCCEKMPHNKAANEFSVREIVCAVKLLEKTKTVEQSRIQAWVNALAAAASLPRLKMRNSSTPKRNAMSSSSRAERMILAQRWIK